MAEIQQGVPHVVLVPAIFSYESSIAGVHAARSKAVIAVILWIFIDDSCIRNIVRVGVVGETGQSIFQAPLQRELESVVTRSCLVNWGWMFTPGRAGKGYVPPSEMGKES